MAVVSRRQGERARTAGADGWERKKAEQSNAGLDQVKYRGVASRSAEEHGGKRRSAGAKQNGRSAAN